MIRELHERMYQWVGGSCKKENADVSLCVGREQADRYERIYAETDTSFEVSGAPLATAAKETGSLWGSVAVTRAGVDVVVS